MKLEGRPLTFLSHEDDGRRSQQAPQQTHTRNGAKEPQQPQAHVKQFGKESAVPGDFSVGFSVALRVLLAETHRESPAVLGPEAPKASGGATKDES